MSEDEETALRATSLSPATSTKKKNRFSLSLKKKNKEEKSPSGRSSRMSLSSIAAILSPRQFSKLRSSASNSNNQALHPIVPPPPAIDDEDYEEDNVSPPPKGTRNLGKGGTKKKKKKHQVDEHSEDESLDFSSSSQADEDGDSDGEYEVAYNDDSSRAAQHTRKTANILTSDEESNFTSSDDDEALVQRKIPRRRIPNKAVSYKLTQPNRRKSDPLDARTTTKMVSPTQNRRSTSSLRQSRQIRPEDWKPSLTGSDGTILNYVSEDRMMTTNWTRSAAPKKDMELTGDEDYRIVQVYKRPPMGESIPTLEPDEDGNKQFQGVWASEIPQGQNPTEVWLFHMEDKPKGLEDSTARYGVWAFNPRSEIQNDEFDPHDLWIYPPGATIPARIEPMGVWMYPRLLAETTNIAPGTSGFVDLIKTQKVGKLGVGGMWKVHFSKDDQLTKAVSADSPKKEPKAIFQVKILTGRGDESVTIFPCKSTDTVWDIRCKLAKAKADLPSDQSLMMQGELLEDDVTLGDYNIHHNTVLELEGMKLYIQDWDKRFFEIRVAPDDTVAMTKELISTLINVPAKMLRISFERALLSKEDGELKKYGLHHFAQCRLEPMQLFLQEANHSDPIKVPVRPVDSIHQVKQRVSQKLNVPLDTPHRLYLEDGTELMDGFHLMDFDVQQGSILRMTAFLISIHDPSTGETVQVNVPEGATVGDVKFACLELSGIPIAHQNLYFNETGPLDSAKKLTEYQITSGAVLSLLTLPPFEIEVVAEGGEATRFVADPTDLLEELQEQIQEHFKIPVTKQVIRLRKRRLKGNLSLAEYGIKDGTSVEVVRVKTFS